MSYNALYTPFKRFVPKFLYWLVYYKTSHAERVECALKVVVPMLEKVSTTQRAMVLGDTGLCGATWLIKREQSCFSLNVDVIPNTTWSVW